MRTVEVLRTSNDIDGEGADDQSGWSVSISHDGLVVTIGATHNAGNGAQSVHTCVYSRTNCNNSYNWSQLGSDLDGTAPGNISVMSVSISGDRMRLAIGTS